MQSLKTFVATAGITLSLAATALAGPAKPAAKAPMCPVCKTMALTTKKTKTNTKAVKIKGKTYYCCAKCKMPAPAKPAAKKM